MQARGTRTRRSPGSKGRSMTARYARMYSIQRSISSETTHAISRSSTECICPTVQQLASVGRSEPPRVAKENQKTREVSATMFPVCQVDHARFAILIDGDRDAQRERMAAKRKRPSHHCERDRRLRVDDVPWSAEACVAPSCEISDRHPVDPPAEAERKSATLPRV